MNLSRWLNTTWMWTCHREWRAFCRASCAPAETQATVLKKMLRANRESEFGLRYDFRSIDSPREYQRRVPLGDDETFRPAIDRMAAGEQNVLTSERVCLFEPTSGTTSTSKLIPYTRSLQRQYQRAIAAWVHNLYRNRPAVRRGRAYWSISPALGERGRTSSGVPIGFDDDSAYLGGWERLLVNRLLAVPQDVAKLRDIDDSRYATLLSLLSAGDLSLISIWSPTFMTALLDGLEDWSDRLCGDLDTGRIRCPSGSVVDDCSRRLRSPICSPHRARQVRRILSSGDTLPERLQQLWPQLALISCWADASSGAFVGGLQHLFPTVEIQPKGLMATEGCLSFPLVGRSGAALALRSHFFEFEEGDFYNAAPVAVTQRCRFAHELEFGGRYGVVLTTAGGLYRYRLGDMVEVVGFENRCPLLRFRGRSSRSSDLVGEKLAEPHVRSVLESLLANAGIAPRFALVVPVAASRPHYRLYLQLSPTGPRDFPVEFLAERLQDGLEQNPYYQHAIQLGQLGPLDVCLLDPQAESGWRVHERRCNSEGTSPGDIKPTVLDTRPGWAQVLEPILQRSPRKPGRATFGVPSSPAQRG